MFIFPTVVALITIIKMLVTHSSKLLKFLLFLYYLSLSMEKFQLFINPLMLKFSVVNFSSHVSPKHPLDEPHGIQNFLVVPFDL
jgi:hypothetical protein